MEIFYLTNCIITIIFVCNCKLKIHYYIKVLFIILTISIVYLNIDEIKKNIKMIPVIHDEKNYVPKNLFLKKNEVVSPKRNTEGVKQLKELYSSGLKCSSSISIVTIKVFVVFNFLLASLFFVYFFVFICVFKVNSVNRLKFSFSLNFIVSKFKINEFLKL